LILNIATVYNRYLSRGGEDEVFERETRLLRGAGHHVVPITTQTVAPGGTRDAAFLARESLWSRRWYGRFLRILGDERIDIVHVHNVFPVFSPSVLHACARAGVPVVHTLHNYRLICPKATLYRDGGVCNDCPAASVPWPGVRHRCYHGSYSQSAVVAAMLTVHRWLRTWTDKVDAYVALTEFARAKLVAGGLPGHKVFVKPNFVDPDPGPGAPERRGGALFVGRLSEEKGVPTLLRAWAALDLPLTIVGDGPLEGSVRRAATASNGGIEYVGREPHADVLQRLGDAQFLVFPSEWYEGMPLSVIEAFSRGTPVVASNLGAMAEIVSHERNGMLFTAGDARDLARAARDAAANGDRMPRLRAAARAEYEEKYTARVNLDQLLAIYERVLAAPRRA
jgi:glycosyltransferase involved in cell wall biosynthesis